MENNINKDNLEEQLISLENKYKNQGIKSKIEIIKIIMCTLVKTRN